MQLIRGPRPQSAKWPMKGSAELQREGSGNSSSRFSSWSASPWSSAWSTTRGEVLSNARARVTKLEAAMAVGKSDPTYVGLQDALKKAKAQAQVRPVADRIASSKVFIERAKKRIITGREEVSRAQEALTSAQAKLQSEEHGLANAEARLASLLLEESNGIAAPPQSLDFAQELAELRVCVQQMQQENTDLRSQLQFEGQGCEGRERKHPRNLSCSTLDLALSTPQSRSRRRLHGAECAPVSRIVRVVCPDGDTDRQRRGQCALEPFQPTVKLTAYRSARAGARYGLRGVRVGEATHAGPDESPHSELRCCSVEPSATFACHTSRSR